MAPRRVTAAMRVRSAPIAEPEAERDVDEKAGVDDGHQFVKADEDVADEQGEQGKEKAQDGGL